MGTLIDVMTPDEFRAVALSLPEASESAHQGHPDFRIGGKVFATLGPADDEDWAMVKLTPELQGVMTHAEPDGFESFAGAWGRQGCTKIFLGVALATSVRDAVVAAWRKTAPAGLVQQYDDERSGA